MRLGGDNRFDLSDELEVDTVDAILDVAAEVLGEYGPDPGNTRIERLARFVAASLGTVTTVQSAGAVSRLRFSWRADDAYGAVESIDATGTVERVARLIGIPQSAHPYTPDGARALASALLRAADLAET